MPNFPFYHVDAFTSSPLGGNACAILLDTEVLSEAQMLNIAGEMNLPETVFVRSSKVADFSLRFFTPAEEVPLAGHPTIATAQALVDAGRIKLSQPTTRISFELSVGNIKVEIDSDHGTVSDIRMSQLKPEFKKIYQPNELLPLFSLTETDVMPNLPLQTVSTGTPQVMIPVKDLDTLKRAIFNIEPYVEYRKSSDFFSPHLFCLEGATSEGATFARHFFPPPDVVEDPFTGSGTGNMAAYVWRYGLLKEPFFYAEQGHFLGRPGKASVRIIGAREDIQEVIIGGQAVTCIRGTFSL